MAGADPASHAVPFRQRVGLGVLRSRVMGRVKPGHERCLARREL
jgi:hypothetical protein